MPQVFDGGLHAVIRGAFDPDAGKLHIAGL
jgi:hypothetical protein